MKVPPGSHAGQKLRLSGKDFAKAAAPAISTRVLVLPLQCLPRLPSARKRFTRSFRQNSRFNPRLRSGRHGTSAAVGGRMALTEQETRELRRDRAPAPRPSGLRDDAERLRSDRFDILAGTAP